MGEHPGLPQCHHKSTDVGEAEGSFRQKRRPLREAETKEKMFCHFEDGGRAMSQNMLLYRLEKAKAQTPLEQGSPGTVIFAPSDSLQTAGHLTCKRIRSVS